MPNTSTYPQNLGSKITEVDDLSSTERVLSAGCERPVGRRGGPTQPGPSTASNVAAEPRRIAKVDAIAKRVGLALRSARPMHRDECPVSPERQALKAGR